jgi:hypothetical protein
MIQLHVLLHCLLADTRERAGAAIRRHHLDRGGVSLEQVVITLGLFVLAGLVVAGITAAVNNRLSLVK